MTPEQLKELESTLGKQTAAEIKKETEAAEKRINEKIAEVSKGMMTAEAFENYKKEQIEPLNKTLEKLEAAAKEQGNKINEFTEKAAPNSRTLESFIAEKMGELKGTGKMIEVTAAQLKVAGVQSISGTVDPSSPYAPGIAGTELEIFDIARNPNFITSRVDLGRTNSSILAWANEKELQGAPAEVAEAGLKPQVQRIFSVETSTAKKIAGWSEFTDEFDQDLPGFATKVRRMLQEDVVRAWDDAVQSFTISNAKGYEITELDGQIQDANFWDAILAMMGQVGFYNFTPNTVAMNWLTNVQVKTIKDSNGTYLLPPFVEDLRPLMAYANKLAVRYALVGDLKQVHVDMYKDFVLKIGYINDEFIYNKYAVVGELRYHRYISDARKKALVYDSLANVAGEINGTPHS